MDEKPKDRLTSTMMGDLLLQLAGRDTIKRLLGEVSERESGDVVRELLDELERIIRKRLGRQLPSERREIPAAESGSEVATAHGGEAQEAPTVSTAEFRLDDLFPPRSDVDLSPAEAVEKPPEGIPSPTTAVPAPGPEAFESGSGMVPPDEFVSPAVETSVGLDAGEPAGTEEMVPGSGAEGADLHTADPEESVSVTELPPALLTPESPPVAQSSAAEFEVQAGAPGPRVSYRFDENAFLYLHAVSPLPVGESAAAGPYQVSQKGIEGREPAFAYEYLGFRFLMSTISGQSMNVSKNGTLLLNKQESISLRQAHEAFLNDLRVEGLLLPFEFGTIARGKDELLDTIDAHLAELEIAFARLESTVWWNLSAFALDSSVAPSDSGSRPARDHPRGRRSYSSTPSVGKYDIKTLEKILNKQKKIAESVHEELSAVADRADIDMIIGLGSGSSDDWKLILKSSYDVPVANRLKFFREFAALQHRRPYSDLMLSLTGDRAQFSFR